MGHGKPLLSVALACAARAGHARVALTDHPENPARFPYQSCGFEQVDVQHGYLLMTARVRRGVVARRVQGRGAWAARRVVPRSGELDQRNQQSRATEPLLQQVQLETGFPLRPAHASLR
jgi:hypothetical protein